MSVTKISAYKPHKVSEVICVRCATRWISVREADMLLKEIECDKCGKGYVIETGEWLDYDE